jgi:uncharacterized protein with FMN-binding domain
MRHRVVTTVGLSVVAVVLILNFRIRDPFLSLDMVDAAPVVTAVAPTVTTAVDRNAPTTTRAPNYPILPTTTTTTQAPLPTSPGAKAVNGPEVETQFGEMQVQIIVADGVIEDIISLKLPDATSTSRLISRIYWRLFRTGTLEAQSADIDFGSGATVTAEAYVESLESAMEIAGML